MQGPDPEEEEEGPVSLWGSQGQEEEEGQVKPPRAKGQPLLSRRPQEQEQTPFFLRSLLPSWLQPSSPQQGCHVEDGVSLFSDAPENRTRNNGCKLQEKGFQLNIRRNFMTHPDNQEASGSRSGLAVDRVTIHENTGSLESILQVLRQSSHPMVKEFLQAQETQFRIFAHLFHENEQLKCHQKDSASQPPPSERQHSHRRHTEEVQIFRPPGETQQPQQERWETRKNHKPAGLQKSSHQKWSFLWSNTDFPVQVLTTGKTGGCEKQFLDGVSKHLSNHRINLQVDDYQENSSRFLLVFCPVASRMGTDIENALEGLSSSVSKALLVVLHHKPKDSHHLFVDTRLQGQHRALVRTVHARYTVGDGLYACRMNEEAMADVAKVIKDLSREG